MKLKDYQKFPLLYELILYHFRRSYVLLNREIKPLDSDDLDTPLGGLFAFADTHNPGFWHDLDSCNKEMEVVGVLKRHGYHLFVTLNVSLTSKPPEKILNIGLKFLDKLIT